MLPLPFLSSYPVLSDLAYPSLEKKTFLPNPGQLVRFCDQRVPLHCDSPILTPTLCTNPLNNSISLLSPELSFIGQPKVSGHWSGTEDIYG